MDTFQIKQIYYSEIDRLLESISSTKPNLHTLWKRYYQEKEKKYMETLKNIMETLKRVEQHNNDIHQDTIDFLYMLYYIETIDR
jgi:hypothetical protein